MNDLDLYLVTSDNVIVASSDSTDFNVEHIFYRNLLPGDYKIVVFHSGGGLGTSEEYGLAWWVGDLPSTRGDFDGNGSVGPEDYDVWKSSFGSSVAAGTGADGNENGVVDAADYVVWRNAMTAGSGSLAAVPEPPSALLLNITAALLGARFGAPRHI